MPADTPPPDSSKPMLGLAATGLAVGMVAWLTGRADVAGWVWLAVTIPVLLALIVEIVRSLLLDEVGLDIVAALSMSAALIFGEYLRQLLWLCCIPAVRFWNALPRVGRGARCAICWAGFRAQLRGTDPAGWRRCRWTRSSPATGC